MGATTASDGKADTKSQIMFVCSFFLASLHVNDAIELLLLQLSPYLLLMQLKFDDDGNDNGCIAEA